MQSLNIINLADKAAVCGIWLEGEIIIGTFVKDEYALFSGLAFKSLICPRFIKEENEKHGSDLTGFYAEVTDIKTRIENDGETKSFISFDEGKTFHLVNLLTFGGEIISIPAGFNPA